MKPLPLKVVAACLGNNTPEQEQTRLPRPTPLAERLLSANVLLGVLPCPVSGNAWEERTVDSVCTDSRDVAPGKVFFCFAGERTDGHDHAPQAVEAGVAAIVATRDPLAKEREQGLPLPPVFLVTNAQDALWLLALRQRSQTNAKVVGITGTAGKTTLKESLASILSCQGATEKNHKNFNTQIGLSMSMINASEDASFWVMEVGISQPHDMEELGSILQPDLSLILNAGVGHTQGLGEKGVDWHKASLSRYTAPNGFVLVNADYPKLVVGVGGYKEYFLTNGIHILTFGTQPPAKIKARYLGQTEEGKGRYTVDMDGKDHTIVAPFFGAYGAENVAALAAAATLLGVAMPLVQKGLDTVILPDMRFRRQDIGSVTLIDDSYNSNPLSARRMLEAASILAKESGRELYCVLGEMRELGNDTQNLHAELGRLIAAIAPRGILWKGNHWGSVMQGLHEADYKGYFAQAQTTEDFIAQNKKIELANIVVLFKGSRGNKLEEYVKEFTTMLQGATRAV